MASGTVKFINLKSAFVPKLKADDAVSTFTTLCDLCIYKGSPSSCGISNSCVDVSLCLLLTGGLLFGFSPNKLEWLRTYEEYFVLIIKIQKIYDYLSQN